MNAATDQELKEAMQSLDTLFNRDTAWKRINEPGRGSVFHSDTREIIFHKDARVADAIHEYAHVLDYARYGMRQAILEGGPHGATFIKILEEVAGKFYGDSKMYPNWDDEYPHITGYAFGKGYIDTPITKTIMFTEWA